MSQTFINTDDHHALLTAYGVNTTHASNGLATVKAPVSGSTRANVAFPREDVRRPLPLIGSEKARREQVTQTILAILEAAALPAQSAQSAQSDLAGVPTTGSLPMKETH
ncbi:MAG: hypothetical protein SOR95_06170 [Sutterella sp.]|nr:hypothetical protein [Sutterella sp.]